METSLQGGPIKTAHFCGFYWATLYINVNITNGTSGSLVMG